MNGYAKKVGHTLLLGLTILAIAAVVWLVYPKYQIQMIKIDDDYVMVTKINTLTGETNTYRERTDGAIDMDYLYNSIKSLKP